MLERSTRKFIAVTRVVTSLGYYLTIPLLGVIALRAGSMSAVEVGALVSAHALFRRGLALPTGVLCDRWGGERVLVAGLVAEAVGYVLLASSITFPVWLAALVIDGAGGAAYNSAGRVVLAKASKEGGSAASFAGFYVATNVGALLGPLLAAALSAHGSPRAALLLSALAYACAAAGALWRFRTVDRSRPVTAAGGSVWRSLVGPLGDRLFVVYCAMTVPLWFGISLLVSALPLEADLRGLGYVDVGVINSLNALVVVALGTKVGKITDGWDLPRRMRFLGAGGLAMAAGCLVCLPAGTPWLYAGMVVITLGELALIAATDIVAVHLAPEGSTGVYLGYVTTAWAVGGVLAGVLAGALLDGSGPGRVVFWAVSTALLLGAAVWFTVAGRAVTARAAAGAART
ncbi:MFS transporter [Sphaerisporangium rufum]|nr:MFS transporter [Sphaerisporangium rufum]